MTTATLNPTSAPPVLTATASLPARPEPEPEPFRWTIAEYRELARAGLFQNKKTMLLNGVLYVMPFPDPPHDAALSKAQRYLTRAFPVGHYVRNQQGFDIGTRSDPGPDLAVVAGDIEDYETRTPTAAVLVVEVAYTSFHKDTTEKAELYARAGVPDYWVVDVVGRRLVVFRDPTPLPHLETAAYRTCLTLSEADAVAPLAAPQAAVTVADLLPRAVQQP